MTIPVRTSRRHRSSAFTLIEVTLAVTLGAFVLIACLGVYGALQRSDRVLAVRFEQTGDVALVRTVVQRMIGSLAMSDEQRPPNGDEAAERTERGKAQAEELTKKAGEDPNEAGTGREKDSKEADDPLKYRPRLLLGTDSAGAVQGVLRRATIAGGTNAGSPQRLEIVAMRAPIRPTFAQAMSPKLMQAAHQQQEAARRQLAGEPDPVYATPMRMALELRPDRFTRWLDGKPRGGADTWTLWWRPLPSDPTVPVPPDPTDDLNAVPLMEGLASCHWRAFHKSQFKDDFGAVWWQDLPAYLEMELETGEGVKAGWLFEVEWVNMKESTDAQAEGVDGDGSGAAGVGGSGGAQEGASGGRPTGASPSGSGRGSVRPAGAGAPKSAKRIPPPNRVRGTTPGGDRGGTKSGGGGGRR